MAETITKRITAVNKNGFQVDGYQNWFNLSKSHEDTIAIPGVGTEIEFTYNPWTNPATKKVTYYVDEIIPVTQVGAQSVAGPHVPGNMAPTPTPVAQAPRNGPEPLSQDTTPVLGTHAYTSLSIENQVALKSAVELLIGVYGVTAHEPKDDGELSRLAVNAMVVADEFRDNFLQRQAIADVAMPDDSLVPTPSESRTAYRGDGGYVDNAGSDPGPTEP